MTPQLMTVPISHIFVSTTNPRKFINPDQLTELAQSISSSGIQVPLSLRARGDSYEIVGGERRWRAAIIAGLKEVPAIVREMSDEQCREAQIIENLQREDLGAMEEADAYAGLQVTLGTVAAVAAKVGKSIKYVTCRLKLRSLIEYSRQALEGRLITVDHALLLAKLAEAEQEQALRYTLSRWATKKDKTADLLASGALKLGEAASWQPQSVLDLRHHIESQIELQLSRAPWDLADVKLVESAGACTACPANTAANTALFGDLAIEEASCTNAACFAAKNAAFVQIQTSAIAKAGSHAVRISWKSSSAAPRMKDNCIVDQVFRAGQWVEAKEGSCGNVVTGVSVDDDQCIWDPKKSKAMGAQLLVCVAGGCKAHKKEWEKPAKQGAARGKYDHVAEEQKREEHKKAVDTENKIRMDLAKQAVAKVKTIPPDALRILMLRAIGYDSDNLTALAPGIKQAVKSSPVNGPGFAKAVAAVILDCTGLHIWNDPKDLRSEFFEALKLFGVDGSQARAKPKPTPPAKKVAAKKKVGKR